jgi:hypothetical protein
MRGPAGPWRSETGGDTPWGWSRRLVRQPPQEGKRTPGRLTVSGLKPAAVANLIADGLKNGYTEDPKVSVEIEDGPTRR